MKIFRTLIYSFIVLMLAAPAWAQESPFSLSFEADRGGTAVGDAVMHVTFEIPPGHYIYRNQIDFALVDTLAFDLAERVMPRGKVKYDQFLESKTEIYEEDMTAQLRLTSKEGSAFPDSARVWVMFQGCTSEFCYFPEEIRVSAAWGDGASIAAVEASSGEGAGGGRSETAVAAASSASGGFDVAEKIRTRGLFLTYLAVFFSGILLSFTPCVFPMIPITLSVIGARGEKNPMRGFMLSLMYVFGMALTYAVLGLVAASTGGLFGSLFQSPAFILTIVAIFVTLAFGMFGAYELQIPSSMATKLQGVGGGGGWISIFLMGIVAGLVASPCVGPVLVGLLVYIAQTGSKMLGFTLLFTLAMGIGVIFLVIGTFSGLLTSMPGAGTWMEEVKKFFGWLLIGVALYFAKPLLPGFVFLPALGLILLLAAATTLGMFDPLPAGAKTVHRIRKAAAILVGSAGVILFLGNLLLPYLPLSQATNVSGPAGPEIEWMRDHDAGIARAEAEGLPMMIDFTADWCAACQELEHYTYTDPQVVEESRRFLSVQVDATRSTDEIKKLKDRYGIRGLPWIVWIDSSGEVLEELTITGFVEAEPYLEIMRSVH